MRGHHWRLANFELLERPHHFFRNWPFCGCPIGEVGKIDFAGVRNTSDHFKGLNFRCLG
jgi:hypothetical protein